MAQSEAQIQPHNIYEIKANPTNVHWGYFSAAVKPALTVDSGDVVIIEDVPRTRREAERAGFAASEIPEDYRAIYREVKDRGPGPHIRGQEGRFTSTEPSLATCLRCRFWRSS